LSNTARRGRRDAVRPSRIGLLTVGETARIIGVSPSTLRLWESVGLITPVRSNGRYRLYDRELLAVVKRIKYLKEVKRLNLPAIQQALGTTSKKATAQAANANGNGHGQPPSNLGPKLRQLRRRHSLGIVEAARRAKISAGFLSAIELSRANPSVATLQRLAATYGTTTLDFYDLPKHSGRLVRPRERRAIQTHAGVRIELLSIGAKQLESQIFRVPPGAGSDGAYSHDGEEFIYMMAGTLELWLEELKCYTLQEGDSFWFESSMGHRWYNPGDQEAVLLWINTPPTF
jgi:DNA-binding transcriptional MerR regulator/quercetin dioxygenase-like cupin family protein